MSDPAGGAGAVAGGAATSFFKTGGTMAGDARSYVARRADEELYRGLLAGEFCHVLTSRQMGKSSLMVRVASRLRADGLGVAMLDLTAFGQNLTPQQWYGGMSERLGRQLGLEDEVEAYWAARAGASPLLNWVGVLTDVALPRAARGLVVFIDEIDFTRSLPFATDELFAAIRECYNRRTTEPALGRLTFCLLGVATPSDLIRDARTTPFNVGRRVELTDFTPGEAAPLAAGLGPDLAVSGPVLARVLHWTGGHPYLTQRLCQAAAEAGEHGDGGGAAGVDRLCDELFLSERARASDDNLVFVRERVLRAEGDLAGLLDLYRRVRAGRRVAFEEGNTAAGVLRLAGIVRVTGGRLAARNRIYARVFDRRWVEEHLPDQERRRQRAAYVRGLLRAGALAAVLVAGVGALAGYALRQARVAGAAAAREAEAKRGLQAGQAALERAREEAERQAREAEAARAEAAREANVARLAWADASIRRHNYAAAGAYLAACEPAFRGWEWRYLNRLRDDSVKRFHFAEEAGGPPIEFDEYARFAALPGAAVGYACGNDAAYALDLSEGRVLWKADAARIHDEVAPYAAKSKFVEDFGTPRGVIPAAGGAVVLVKYEGRRRHPATDAAAGSVCAFQLRDARTGAPRSGLIKVSREHYDVFPAVNASGTRVLTEGLYSYPQVEVWDPAAPDKPLATWNQDGSGVVYAAALVGDGSRVAVLTRGTPENASAGVDRTVLRVYDVSPKRLVREVVLPSDPPDLDRPPERGRRVTLLTLVGATTLEQGKRCKMAVDGDQAVVALKGSPVRVDLGTGVVTPLFGDADVRLRDGWEAILVAARPPYYVFARPAADVDAAEVLIVSREAGAARATVTAVPVSADWSPAATAVDGHALRLIVPDRDGDLTSTPLRGGPGVRWRGAGPGVAAVHAVAPASTVFVVEPKGQAMLFDPRRPAAVTADDRRVVGIDRRGRVWRVESDAGTGGDGAAAAAAAPDKPGLVLVCHDPGARGDVEQARWQAGPTAQFGARPGVRDGEGAFAFDGAGERFAYVEGRELRVVDLARGGVRPVPVEGDCVAGPFGPDGDSICVVDRAARALRIYALSTGKVLRAVPLWPGESEYARVAGVAWTSGGVYVHPGRPDLSGLWIDPAVGKAVPQPPRGDDRDPLLAPSPSGRYLAIAEAERVTVYDTRGGGMSPVFEERPDARVNGVAWSADEQRLFVGDGRRLRVYDFPRRREILSTLLDADAGPLWASPDGLTVIAGSATLRGVDDAAPAAEPFRLPVTRPAAIPGALARDMPAVIESSLAAPDDLRGLRHSLGAYGGTVLFEQPTGVRVRGVNSNTAIWARAPVGDQFAASVDFHFTKGGDLGLWAAGPGYGNSHRLGYCFRVTADGDGTLYRDGAAVRKFRAPTLDRARWHAAGVVREGSVLTLLIDGEVVTRYADAQPLSGPLNARFAFGSCGGSWDEGVRFRDLTVRAAPMTAAARARVAVEQWLPPESAERPEPDGERVFVAGPKEMLSDAFGRWRPDQVFDSPAGLVLTGPNASPDVWRKVPVRGNFAFEVKMEYRPAVLPERDVDLPGPTRYLERGSRELGFTMLAAFAKGMPANADEVERGGWGWRAEVPAGSGSNEVSWYGGAGRVLVASTPYFCPADGRAYTVRLECRGDRARLFLDGRLLLSAARPAGSAPAPDPDAGAFVGIHQDFHGVVIHSATVHRLE